MRKAMLAAKRAVMRAEGRTARYQVTFAVEGTHLFGGPLDEGAIRQAIQRALTCPSPAPGHSRATAIGIIRLRDGQAPPADRRPWRWRCLECHARGRRLPSRRAVEAKVLAHQAQHPTHEAEYTREKSSP